MNSDRLSIRRSQYDFQPEDKLADLIDFTIRGPRGAVKARVTVDRRIAARYHRDLGKLLGKDESS